jgi:hypothetical protein
MLLVLRARRAVGAAPLHELLQAAAPAACARREAGVGHEEDALVEPDGAVRELVEGHHGEVGEARVAQVALGVQLQVLGIGKKIFLKHI